MSGCEAENTDAYGIAAYIGSAMLAIGPLYQAYKMYQKKQTKDVSMKWTLNYLVGLFLVTLFSIVNNIWSISAGQIVEFISMTIVLVYKVYRERKFLCIDRGKPEVHEIHAEEFKQLVIPGRIAIYMTHEELDDIINKSNDDEDILYLEFTQAELESMLESVKNVPPDQNGLANLDFNTIHNILLSHAKSISSQDTKPIQLNTITTQDGITVKHKSVRRTSTV